jgi:hypothetical protein
MMSGIQRRGKGGWCIRVLYVLVAVRASDSPSATQLCSSSVVDSTDQSAGPGVSCFLSWSCRGPKNPQFQSLVGSERSKEMDVVWRLSISKPPSRRRKESEGAENEIVLANPDGANKYCFCGLSTYIGCGHTAVRISHHIPPKYLPTYLAMVGIPGRSKACHTCLTRRKGVSQLSFRRVIVNMQRCVT